MTITAPHYNIKGEIVGKTTLPVAYFGVAVNEILLTQAVRVYQSNQRQGTKKTKTRGEVNYTTQKMWRQKGTGRARHGSKSAPIFVGGGVAHGPTGKEAYTLKLTKRMRQLALKSALSQHALNKTVLILDDIAKLPPKTKALKLIFGHLNPSPTKSVLFILSAPNHPIVKASNNLKGITVSQIKRLNVFEILKHSLLIFDSEALSLLK